MKQLSVLSIFCFLFFISCKQKRKDKWDDTLNSGLIRVACDENFKPLMNAALSVFEARNPKAIIVPIYTNEREVIRLLVEDSVRFALATRDLNVKEQQIIERHLMKVKKHLIAFDGVTLITNVLNKDSIIGLPVLEKILTGEVTEWSQVNPNSPWGTIRIIFDNKDSGVLRYVVDSIVRRTVDISKLYALNNYLEVIEKVIQLPNAIGIIGFNVLHDSYSDYGDKIRLVRIGKEELATVNSSCLPDAGNIMTENYPLWRPVYVLLSDPCNGLSSGLSIFLANEIGQKIILKSGLLPITDAQIMPVIIKNEYPKNN